MALYNNNIGNFDETTLDGFANITNNGECCPEDMTPEPPEPETLPLPEPEPEQLSVRTQGAPQPEDYKGGGTDPQYLKDKAAFIKRMGGDNTKNPLRERLQKLAGLKNKK